MWRMAKAWKCRRLNRAGVRCGVSLPPEGSSVGIAATVSRFKGQVSRGRRFITFLSCISSYFDLFRLISRYWVSFSELNFEVFRAISTYFDIKNFLAESYE